MGEAFQFTPFGLVSGLGAVDIPDGINPDAMIEFRPAVGQAQIQQTPKPSVSVIQPVHTMGIIGTAQAPTKPPTPKDIVKMAIARTKEIRAELRTHARLERELRELTQLITAARRKPTAVIRKLDTARPSRPSMEKTQ